MKQRLFALAAAVVMALGLTACGGSGSSEGRTGDTMETYFFDFTVNSAYLTSDYAGRAKILRVKNKCLNLQPFRSC